MAEGMTKRTRARKFLPPSSIVQGRSVWMPARVAVRQYWRESSVHWQTASRSALVGRALRWISRYLGSGISPLVTCSQISSSLSSLLFAGYSAHSEKFIFRRASCTSLAIIHDTGATWLYHGHSV